MCIAGYCINCSFKVEETDKEFVGNRLMRMDVERRREGRAKWRWMDSVCVDLREKGLSGEEKGRTSEVEVDGQCVCGLKGEGTVRGGEGKDERSGGGWTVCVWT